MSEKVENIIIDGEGSASTGKNPTPRKATGSKASSAKDTPKDSKFRIPRSTTESSNVSQTSPLSKFSSVTGQQQSKHKITPRKHHKQKHRTLNKRIHQETNRISNQNTTHEEVNKTEEIEVIEEIEETDHIVDEIKSVIHNPVKVNEANKAQALIEQIVEHNEVKNGLHQDQAAQKAIETEIHQDTVQDREAKQSKENLILVHTVGK